MTFVRTQVLSFSAATVVVFCGRVRQAQAGVINRCALILRVDNVDPVFRLMYPLALGLGYQS